MPTQIALESGSLIVSIKMRIYAIPKTTNLCGVLIVSWPGIPLRYILMFLSSIGNFVQMSQQIAHCSPVAELFVLYNYLQGHRSCRLALCPPAAWYSSCFICEQRLQISIRWLTAGEPGNWTICLEGMRGYYSCMCTVGVKCRWIEFTHCVDLF